jgi:hypothetical protein
MRSVSAKTWNPFAFLDMKGMEFRGIVGVVTKSKRNQGKITNFAPSRTLLVFAYD